MTLFFLFGAISFGYKAYTNYQIDQRMHEQWMVIQATYDDVRTMPVYFSPKTLFIPIFFTAFHYHYTYNGVVYKGPWFHTVLFTKSHAESFSKGLIPGDAITVYINPHNYGESALSGYVNFELFILWSMMCLVFAIGFQLPLYFVRRL
ncbi:hypothetical protein KBD59_03805 [Candidatus Gracilibacteria bacterium]|nr:hypothetical protein [Candidatus Gracilibacteria bacterium]